jgi:uncharacterized membrane protein
LDSYENYLKRIQSENIIFIMMILVLKYAKKISLPLGMKGVFFIEITLCKVKKNMKPCRKLASKQQRLCCAGIRNFLKIYSNDLISIHNRLHLLLNER